MERYSGMDAHAGSCKLAVISQNEKRLKDFPVETNGQALAEKLRVGNLDKQVLKTPRQLTCLREFSRIHLTVVGDVVRTQSRIKSLPARALAPSSIEPATSKDS